jgi:hypothetical protein
MNHLLQGIIDSLRIDLIISVYLHDKILSKLIKIMQYNFLLYVIPYLILLLLGYENSKYIIILSTILNCVYYVKTFFNYYDFSYQLCKEYSVVKTQLEMKYMAYVATMYIFQLFMYTVSYLIYLVLKNIQYHFAYFVHFCLIVFYHSFVLYNYMWQANNIKHGYILNIHEKCWLYFFGYGILISLIYMSSNNLLCGFIYNMYYLILITIPFKIKNIGTENIFNGAKINKNLIIPNYYCILDLHIFSNIAKNVLIYVKNNLSKINN